MKWIAIPPDPDRRPGREGPACGRLGRQGVANPRPKAFGVAARAQAAHPDIYVGTPGGRGWHHICLKGKDFPQWPQQGFLAMGSRDQSFSTRNRIIRALPPATLDKLGPQLRTISLATGQCLTHAGDRAGPILFVDHGLISLVKVLRDGRSVEVGTVGIEGMTDPFVVCGMDRRAVESIVQIPGAGLEISRHAFEHLLARDAALELAVRRYAHFSFVQLAQTAACNRLHTIEERLCRWILTGHDSGGSELPLTHEALGATLGVPRSSISLVAKHLEHAGLIEHRRGMTTVSDRRGLEAMACECYFETAAEIERCFGPDPDDRPCTKSARSPL